MGVQTLGALGMGFYCKVTLIACFLGLAAPACAQVRVITGGTEHFDGPGGQLLDDAELRARNERVERSRQSKEARPRSPLTLPSPPAAPTPSRRRSLAGVQSESKQPLVQSVRLNPRVNQ